MNASSSLPAAASAVATSLLHSVPTSSALAARAPPPDDPNIFWLTLSLVYSTAYLLQRIAFATTKFATYTLPAWLFTLFSMSLTFTMNFTTLYAKASDPPYSVAQSRANVYAVAA